MSYTKGEKIYEGKAKVAFQVKEDESLIYLFYKDSLTAFNAQKKGDFSEKGQINNQITTLIFQFLKQKGVESHWVESPDENVMVAKKVEIIPLEVVVRNVLAGSTAKKFAIEEGTVLEKPLVEFYYKDDDLGDPFISDEQALMLKAATQPEMDELKKKALKVNECLIPLFDEVGIQLIDFKLEFGKELNGNILLADEITPDTCRLWDKNSGEKMDKDRFRRDLGQVKEYYEDVLKRLREVIK